MLWTYLASVLSPLSVCDCVCVCVYALQVQKKRRSASARAPEREWVRGFVGIWQRTAFKLFDYVLHLLANWHLITQAYTHTHGISTIKNIRSRVFIFRSIAPAITSWIKCAAGIYYYQRSSSVFSIWFLHHQHQYHIIFSDSSFFYIYFAVAAAVVVAPCVLQLFRFFVLIILAIAHFNGNTKL